MNTDAQLPHIQGMEKTRMSKNNSRLAIFGAIIGFFLVYFIVSAAVDQVQADRDTLKEFGVATVQDIQQLGVEGVEEIVVAEAEAAAAEDEAAAETEVAVEDAVEEAVEDAEEAVVEEAVVEEAVVEEDENSEASEEEAHD